METAFKTTPDLYVPLDIENEHMHTNDSWRDRLGSMRSVSMDKLASFKSNLSSLKMRDRMSSMGSSIDGKLRSNPGLWTGVAAGAGFALGLTGRFMRRSRRMRSMPSILVIEGC